MLRLNKQDEKLHIDIWLSITKCVRFINSVDNKKLFQTDIESLAAYRRIPNETNLPVHCSEIAKKLANSKWKISFEV